MGIVADAKQATTALVEALDREDNAILPIAYLAIRRARAKIAQEIRDIQPQVDYLEVLRRALPADAIVTDELSQVEHFTSWYAFPVYQPRTFISSGYQGNLGSGFPTALGAKVAFPSRTVWLRFVAMVASCLQFKELATAAQYGINLIILLFNNNAYANVLRDQETGFEGRIAGAHLKNPDFIKLAKSFDIQAERVATPEQFGQIINRGN